MEQPTLTVGILSADKIKFELNGSFELLAPDLQGDFTPLGAQAEGPQEVSLSQGCVTWQGQQIPGLLFIPVNRRTASFDLRDVAIGKNFHWQRKEDQRFQGGLAIIVEESLLTAVNLIPLELYLTSVISSEMSATASLELLKAHAVISRSWALKMLQRSKNKNHGRKEEGKEIEKKGKKEEEGKEGKGGKKKEARLEEGRLTDSEGLVWYDTTSHTHYDLCADDHCQRYQGITRASTPQALQAIRETYGQVLTYEGEVCDARFSKCCGGVTEEFQYCWEDVKHPYLTRVEDPFCNTSDKKILSQVLNNYDQETIDFYRWTVSYTRKELSSLIRERSGVDYGDILDLIPLKRGTSGRIWKLQIVGSRQTRIVGKELEIRRILSHSHLYSSAFEVEKADDRFILHGKGWGHGVGLCQIGAAVMGEQGHHYDEILKHYYPGAEITTLYKAEE